MHEFFSSPSTGYDEFSDGLFNKSQMSFIAAFSCVALRLEFMSQIPTTLVVNWAFSGSSTWRISVVGVEQLCGSA